MHPNRQSNENVLLERLEQNVSLSKQMHALTHPLLSSTWSPMACKRDSFGYSVVFVLAFHSGGKSNSLFELGEQKASYFPVSSSDIHFLVITDDPIHSVTGSGSMQQPVTRLQTEANGLEAALCFV